MTPNTQITQENVKCGCVYCADLGAPELCRGYDRPALSPPAPMIARPGSPPMTPELSAVVEECMAATYPGDDGSAPSPPAEGSRRGTMPDPMDSDYLHDIGMDEGRTPTPAPAETFEGFNLSNIKRTDAPAVDWERVGPKLVEALERIAHPQYGLGFNKLRGLARAALAAAQPEGRS